MINYEEKDCYTFFGITLSQKCEIKHIKKKMYTGSEP